MNKILIVDDSRAMLMSLEGMLSKSGYAVEMAISGQEALDKIQAAYTPDLVITDLNMPVMNGIELIVTLRRNATLRFTPILMLTTETQQRKRDEARQAGATGWLVKPILPDQLVQVLKQVLPG